jgi:flagellar hook-associated protein 3 FlgL
VGYNQNIQVNTNGNEVFTPDLQRDSDDLNNAMTDLTKINKVVTELKSKLSGLSSGTTEYTTAETQLEAANKAYSYVRDNVQTIMEKRITNYQTYNDSCSVAITENGTRSTRLNLIKTRLMSQQSTFKDLQESNEGIDMSTVAVQLSSAELTYEASLKATSKILQNSLMNYI